MLNAPFCHFDSNDMNNDGVVRRPPFDLENLCDGFFVKSICGEAIHRFGRQGDNVAGPKRFSRALDGRLKEPRRVG